MRLRDRHAEGIGGAVDNQRLSHACGFCMYMAVHAGDACSGMYSEDVQRFIHGY